MLVYTQMAVEVGLWGALMTTRRVLRGGSWANNNNNARSAYRNNNNSNNRNNNNGFRLCSSHLSVPLSMALSSGRADSCDFIITAVSNSIRRLRFPD